MNYLTSLDRLVINNLKKKKPTILIVEDDEILSRLYSTVFSLCGWKAESQKLGRDALKSIHKSKPDLILLDVALPDIDGFEVLKKVKQQKETKNLPTVMITNYFDAPEDVKKGLKLGAVEYLLKSDYTPKEVVRVVSRVLNYPCATH